MDARELVDYAASLDCIHCGLCLATCPTYRLTGSESSSPRGRIYLMRGVAEGRLDAADPGYGEELEFCLVCRHCESVCPAGVRFGEMMETARDALPRSRPRGLPERLARWLGFRVLLPSRALTRLAFDLLRLAQRTGFLRLAAPLFGERGRSMLALPRVPQRSERRPLPPVTPARTERHGAVALLEGCVGQELYGRVNRATADSLAALGLEVRCPKGHACCGALHAHNGDLEGARALARETIAAFDELREGPPGGPSGGPGGGLRDGRADERGEPLPVVTNSAGCGAHMKAYGHLFETDAAWRERARRFALRVRDYSEVAAERIAAARPPLSAPDLPGPLAWDDPCHLCHGQGIRSQPRELLDAIPGLARVELEASETCCGSAGIYSLLRPRDSQAVFASKLADLRASGAKLVVTANPGCQLQWESGLARAGEDAAVMHLAEVLAASLVPKQAPFRSR